MSYNESLGDINNFVTYVKSCKNNIASALIEKGVGVYEGDKLDTFASKVLSITGGSTETIFLVVYKDYDDTILKSQHVLLNGDVLPPTEPSREMYKFTGWDNSSLNVQSDIMITAQYVYAPNAVKFLDFTGKVIDLQYVETGQDAVTPLVEWENLVLNSWSDYTNIQGCRVIFPSVSPSFNKSIVKIVIDSSTGLSPTFYYWSATGSVTIDFGDGSNVIDNNHGDRNASHTYTSYGTYIVTFNTTGEAVLGKSATYPGPLLSSNYKQAIRSCYCGSLPITQYTLLDGINVDGILLKDTVTHLSNNSLQGCTSLESIILNSGITSIEPYALQGCSSLKSLILRCLSKVTLSNVNAIDGVHVDFKIYVPDTLVDTYKVDPTWSVFSNKIYSILEIQ